MNAGACYVEVLENSDLLGSFWAVPASRALEIGARIEFGARTYLVTDVLHRVQHNTVTVTVIREANEDESAAERTEAATATADGGQANRKRKRGL